MYFANNKVNIVQFLPISLPFCMKKSFWGKMLDSSDISSMFYLYIEINEMPKGPYITYNSQYNLEIPGNSVFLFSFSQTHVKAEDIRIPRTTYKIQQPVIRMFS